MKHYVKSSEGVLWKWETHCLSARADQLGYSALSLEPEEVRDLPADQQWHFTAEQAALRWDSQHPVLARGYSGDNLLAERTLPPCGVMVWHQWQGCDSIDGVPLDDNENERGVLARVRCPNPVALDLFHFQAIENLPGRRIVSVASKSPLPAGRELQLRVFHMFQIDQWEWRKELNTPLHAGSGQTDLPPEQGAVVVVDVSIPSRPLLLAACTNHFGSIGPAPQGNDLDFLLRQFASPAPNLLRDWPQECQERILRVDSHHRAAFSRMGETSPSTSAARLREKIADVLLRDFQAFPRNGGSLSSRIAKVNPELQSLLEKVPSGELQQFILTHPEKPWPWMEQWTGWDAAAVKRCLPFLDRYVLLQTLAQRMAASGIEESAASARSALDGLARGRSGQYEVESAWSALEQAIAARFQCSVRDLGSVS